jgi:ribonuclease HI
MTEPGATRPHVVIYTDGGCARTPGPAAGARS